MTQISADDLAGRVGRVDVISTDVFDTLLLRTNRSERTRIALGERTFSRWLMQRNLRCSSDLLIDARLEAQRLAFRALNVGLSGEVRLLDIIERQLRLLGLPVSLVHERLRIEIEVEKSSLVANGALAQTLRAHRQAGARIIAVSDTTLPEAAVRELIEQFHGPELVHRVYSSAEFGKTKRRGNLFATVAALERTPPERMIHLGDDYAADVEAAVQQGLAAHHASRGPFRTHARRLDGAVTEAGRVIRRTLRLTTGKPSYEDAFSFGREVLGPITAQFCQLIWLYAAQAEASHQPVLLFCARGGIGIREAFELTMDKLQLPLKARRENIAISRVIAARTALVTRADGPLEELEREFKLGTLAEGAVALGGRDYELGPEWQVPFSSEGFIELLFGPTGGAVLEDIRLQNKLFARHLMQLVAKADRIILCDTGLFGSTQRMLAAGHPELALETVQFARSNYKEHGEEHFPKVAGLLIERTGYSPLDVHSCVLRYWHLIESLFEPAVPSARLFTEDAAGAVSANCGEIAYGTLDPSQHNRLLAGALAYIRALPAGKLGVVQQDAAIAWRQLKRAITQPGETDLRCLTVEDRSVDFGRAGIVKALIQPSVGIRAQLLSVREQLWREGAIARDFPVLKHAILPVLESVQSVRGVRSNARPRGAKNP